MSNGLSGLKLWRGVDHRSSGFSNGDSATKVSMSRRPSCVAFENKDAGRVLARGRRSAIGTPRTSTWVPTLATRDRDQSHGEEQSPGYLRGRLKSHRREHVRRKRRCHQSQRKPERDRWQSTDQRGTGTKPTVVRNPIMRTVGNNANNSDVAAGNRFGPIVDITTGAMCAVSGNSAAKQQQRPTRGQTSPTARSREQPVTPRREGR